MTAVAANGIGYRSMAGPPRLNSDPEALLRGVARRDTDASASFYDQTRSRVYRLVARALRDSGYIEETTDVVAGSAIAGDERRRATACLDGMADAHRQCIEMAYCRGLTYVEVSQRLSAKLSTIKPCMRDALRSLRHCLGVT